MRQSPSTRRRRHDAPDLSRRSDPEDCVSRGDREARTARCLHAGQLRPDERPLSRVRLMTSDELCWEVVRRGLVEVDSERGRVIAPRFRNKPLGCCNQKGYRVATLHLDGERKQIKLHRLVWIAVNGLPPRRMVIDHINRDKADNRIANLRLVDDRANAENRRRYYGTANPAARINHSIASAIRLAHVLVKSHRKVARQFSVSPSLVGQIVRGERWLEVSS